MMASQTMDQELSSPLLAAYRLSERRAILVHKYFLGIDLGYDPGIEAAIASWESRFAEQWRRQRQLDDCQAQMEEIVDHRRRLSMICRREVSWEEAAHDWVHHHADQWRRQREQRFARQR